MAAATLAKTSCPVLYEPLGRERLFELLDHASSHPAVWICGPPGSGKTTLIASWLQARNASALWYQMGDADQDPATFFYYFSRGARYRQPRRRPSPFLEPELELSPDVVAFSRRYFANLFARLGTHAVVVLDNLHELPQHSVLYSALAAVVEDSPTHAQLVLISREQPHAAFAVLEASRAMPTLNAEQLKFTLKETELLLAARGESNPGTAKAMHELCQGWAAGLSLMIERRYRGELSASSEANDSLQDIFDYFAEGILTRIPASDQRVLLRLADLPRFSLKLAVQVSGDDNAAGLIESLYRRNLFVDRLLNRPTDNEPSYQFHDLFRGFLRKRARMAFSAEERAAGRCALAGLLKQSGAIEDAFALIVEAADWEDAIRLIYEHSPKLLRQGRKELLRKWIAMLPSERVSKDRWLLHWSGIAQIGSAPARAANLLKRAYSLAVEAGDAMCQVQSAAGIIETVFLEYAQFARVDAWVDILDGLLPSLKFTDANAELRAYAALIAAILQRRGNPPPLEGYVLRTLELLQEADSANLKVAAATHLLRYGVLVGRMAIAKQALALVQHLLFDPDISSLRKGLCEQFAAWFYVNVPQEERARKAIERMEQRAREEGNLELLRFGAITGYWLEMSHLRTIQAARWIQVLEEVMNPGNAYDAGCLAAMKAWSGLAAGDDVGSALRCAADSVGLFDEAGSCWHRIFSRGILSWAYAEAEDFESAVRCSKQGRQIADETNIHVLDVQFDQIDAITAIARGQSVQEALRRLFSSASHYGTSLPLRFFPSIVPRLCAIALQSDIQASYVTALIRTWGWRSKDLTSAAWPWPVRVYALGGFDLDVGGEPITFYRNAPRKVLSLLKALICMGVRGIRDSRLVDAVWPEHEGDAGKASFNVTLHRLRKLLQHPDAIQVEDGLVTLNTEVCWIDAIAFERLLETPRDQEQVKGALALYRGNLLPEDDEEPWSHYYREKLRRKFLHEVVSLASELESSHQWPEAIDLYQRGLDADNLVEAFYQGLMRCYRSIGRTLEAIAVYRRMRHLFSVTLGVEPTSESETLYRSLLAARRAITGEKPADQGETPP